ncbi:zinc-binding dehydrogenase [Paraburkholderia sp. XV]|uniref:zinc-binding dehydrogenase n=1 Tax=Paraburkholderia sp. XV TaxID=2831520 RepID=UPI001CD539D7|nr:zinc-binding dehydrogenase [Paraburkholderia sp. XV]
MKAAVLNAFGTRLSIETLPDPVIGTGEIIVDVVATGVASYAHGVFSGARNYLLEPPLVPGAGAIGLVRAVGRDSTRLAVGDWVYCDPTIRARDNAINPDTILQGWTARNASALSLHRFYHHGSFATQMLVPTENVTAIGDLEERDAGKWCALSQLLVPFGGLVAGELQPGDTVLVNGATGGFGSAGVVAALAMGAAKVVAAGRNQQKLDELARQLGPRVSCARMTGDVDDTQRIRELAEGEVDLVLDILPRGASASQVLAGAKALRRGGRLVLMGGVRKTGEDEPALPYAWLMHNEVTLRGQWMYPRVAIPQMVSMIRAGLVSLTKFNVTEFSLDDANEAIAFAADNAGPLSLVVIRPYRRKYTHG